MTQALEMLGWNHSMKLRPILSIIVFALTLAGCSITRAEQAEHHDDSILSNDSSLGQTFFSRYHGLTGIEVYFLPSEGHCETFTLYLKSNPSSKETLATAKLALNQNYNHGFYRFSFPPIWDSQNKDFFFELVTDCASGIRIATANGHAYLNGALYVNKKPVDAQMTFRLIYDPIQLGLGVGLLALSWLPILILGLMLCCVPGWLLLKLTWTDWDALHWTEKFALSTSTSLSIYPLLFLWSHLIGIQLGSLFAWLPAFLGGIGLIWLNRKGIIQGIQSWKHKEKSMFLKNRFAITNPSSAEVYFLITLFIIFAVRFWVIRNLDVPLWGDSYQHTLIAQLLVDHRGLFNTWQPYADLQTFTYHFGFHSMVAVFHWFTKISMPKATLWMGQILNGLAVISLYPFTSHISKNKWGGIAALFIAGLLTPMPMYYLNWGRYTQLAGQVILPGLIYFLWQTLERKQLHWKSIILNCVLFSGLALTHYRVLIFAILFLLALCLVKLSSSNRRILLIQSFLIGLGSGLLFLPWFYHVFSGKILTILGIQLSTSPQTISAWTEQYNAIGNLTTYLPPWLWLLIPIFIGFGLWQRNHGALIISLWWFLLILAANPRWLGLPGEGILQNFTVFIASYIPVSLLGGVFLGQAVKYIGQKIHYNSQQRISLTLTSVLSVLLFCGFAWYGVRQRINDLNLNQSALVTRPDLKAFQWIINNTTPDARFLVNSFPAYDDTLIVGADAGWWIPLLTRRQTTLPPINYGSERGPRDDYRLWVNELTKEILHKGITNPDVISILEQRNVSHVYIGQRQGKVNNPSSSLEPNELLASPYYSPIYHQDRVWIFRLNPP